MKKYLYTIFSIAFLLVSCTGDFEEINDNDVTSSQIDPELLFTRSLVTGSGISYTVYQWMHEIRTSFWAQHWSNIVGSSGNFQGDIYNPIPGTNVWDFYYSRKYFAPLFLNNEVKKLIDDTDQSPLKTASADIWDVYLFALITDLYGDIPYSDAFQSITPKYDTQEFIYTDMLQRLEEDVRILEENQSLGFATWGGGDVLYQGNMQKWINFANSMRLRMAMRIEKVNPGLCQSTLDKIDLNQLILTNSDNALMNTEPASQALTHYTKNPLGFSYVWQDFRISKSLMDWLDGSNTNGVIDPRLYQFAEPAAKDGGYHGLENGQDPLYLQDNQDDIRERYSNLGPFYNSQADVVPFFLLTASETNFLLAEASAKGLIGGNASSYYQDAIRLSMEQYGITAGVNEYLGAEGVNYDPSKGLEQIATQKWISLFANGVEAWNELRRTGYPKLEAPVYTFPGNPDMPRRFTYSVDEANYNSNNYNEAATRMGGDTQYTRMWWDVAN